MTVSDTVPLYVSVVDFFLFVLFRFIVLVSYHSVILMAKELLSEFSICLLVPLCFQAGGRRRRPNLGLVCVLLCNLCYLYSLVKMDCGVLFYLVQFSLVLCVPSVR